MEQRSIFFDEWIISLREQYKYVIRNNDNVTLPSLTKVLHNVGFTDDELAQLRVEATMHVDDVGTDYIPDMNVLEPSRGDQPHPAECTCPQCIPIDESLYDEDGQPLKEVDPDEAIHQSGHLFPVAKVEDTPPTDLIEESSPDLTFEDQLQQEAEIIEPDDEIEDDDDQSEDDADQPKQMSMF